MVRELVGDGADRRQREQGGERRVRSGLEPRRGQAPVHRRQRVEGRIAVGQQVRGRQSGRRGVVWGDYDREWSTVARSSLVHGARPAAAGSRGRLKHACATHPTFPAPRILQTPLFLHPRFKQPIFEVDMPNVDLITEYLSSILFEFRYFVGLSDVSCIQCTLNLP